MTSDSQHVAGELRPEPIELVFPARTRYSSLVRMVAAALCADAGFTVDEIDDLKLGINEVVSSLATDPTVARVRIVFEAGPRLMTVVICDPDIARQVQLDELASTILRSVVDDVVVTDRDVTLTRHATEASNG